jgi:hypothetical protein
MAKTKTPVTYLTLKQFASKHAFVTCGSLRQIIFKNKGFEKACVRRLGRKVLIDEEKALEYIESSIEK